MSSFIPTMNSQIIILFLFAIGTLFFHPTHQYRLSKRELTEYDLTSFIVSTCSLDQTDVLVQGLCDQTLQSALMGNFPILTYYCKTIGIGMRYCNNINQYAMHHHNLAAKRYAFRRVVRSLDKVDQQVSTMNTEIDFDQKQIMQICIIPNENSSLNADQFCNKILAEFQQGRYPEIKYLCKSHPKSNFCDHIRFYSSLLDLSFLS